MYILWDDDTYAEEAETLLFQIRESNEDFWNSQGQGRIGMRSFWAPFGDLNIETEWDAYFPSEEYYDKLRNIKRRFDPYNLFRGRLTIPLPIRRSRYRRNRYRGRNRSRQRNNRRGDRSWSWRRN